MKALFTTSIFFFFINIHVCSSQVDSLKTLMQNESDPLAKAKLIDDISWDYLYNDLDSSIYYIKQFKRLSESNAILDAEYIYYNRLGNVNFLQSELDSASYFYAKAQESLELEKNDSTKFYKVVSNFANIENAKGNYKEARMHFSEVLDYYKSVNDSSEIIKANINIGVTFQNQGKVKDASNCLFKAYSLSKETKGEPLMGYITSNLCALLLDYNVTPKDCSFCVKAIEQNKNNSRVLQTARNNFAVCTRANGNAAEAKEILLENITNSVNDLALFHSYNELGGIYLDANIIDSALVCYINAIDLVKGTDYHYEVATANTALADTYNRLQDYRSAEKYAKSGLVEFENMGEIQNSVYAQALYFYALARSNQNKPTNSFYLETYKSIKDSLTNIESITKINDLVEKYESDIKQAKNDKLEKENQIQQAQLKTQQAYLIGGGGVLLLLGILASFFYKQRKKEKQFNDELLMKNEKISFLKNEALHRTKNQIALVSNLITNQKKLIGVLPPEELIQDIDSKVKALTEVNRSLEINKNGSTVNVVPIFQSILENNIYSLSNKNIAVIIETEEVMIEANKVSDLSLIINELSTNSIKYAFTSCENPQIRIDFNERDNNIVLQYMDNGKTTVSTKKTVGKGTDLIDGIVQHLGGKNSAIFTEEGYKTTITIPHHDK